MDVLRDARVRGARGDSEQGARHQRRLLVAGRTHVRTVDRNAAVHRLRSHEDVQHHPQRHRRRRIPAQHHAQRHRPHQKTLPVNYPIKSFFITFIIETHLVFNQLHQFII